MTWNVEFTESAEGDLRAFDKKARRLITEETATQLGENPKATGKHIKDLRPNLVAQRELRIAGHFRVLFNIDDASGTVIVRVVGLKAREILLVRGKEYTEHHEVPPTEGS